MTRPIPPVPDALTLCPKCQGALTRTDAKTWGDVTEAGQGKWSITLECKQGHTYGWMESSQKLLPRWR